MRQISTTAVVAVAVFSSWIQQQQLLLLVASPAAVSSFSSLGFQRQQPHRNHPYYNQQQIASATSTSLYDGRGIAKEYEWTEDAVEIEIRVKVPRSTRPKDVTFKAKPLSVDLQVKNRGDNNDNDQKTNEADDESSQGSSSCLLDGNREMRGRVAMDGTFWNMEDNDDDDDSRTIVVTVEKNIRASSDDFEIVDYDWGGVYPDDEDEVISRTYVEPEELDIREYAASMGVDIDNINMSLVDKTMFTSGLNMTKSTMDQLSKAGYVEEVTQQGDGSEFTTDPETGESVPFNPYGKSGVSRQEADSAATRPQIPFLDTTSPWKAAVPAYNMDALTKDLNAAAEKLEKSKQEDFSSAGAAATPATTSTASKNIIDPILLDDKTQSLISDPIERLTVKRLKDILREQGLKVSGTKVELQQRLKDHVQSQLTSDSL